MPAPHIEDNFLDQYAAGTLPPARLEGVEEHLLQCPDCQSRLDASDKFAILFRTAAMDPTPVRIACGKEFGHGPDKAEPLAGRPRRQASPRWPSC